MNAFFTSLSALTGGLLKVSLQASLVVALLLLVQWLGRKHLSPRVRYALWLLVVARLLLPVSLESKVSLFNFTRATPANVFQAGGAASNVSAARVETNRAPAPTADAAAASAKVPAAKSEPPISASPSATVPSAASLSTPRENFPWASVLSGAWLAGVIFLLARIIWIPLRLNARLAQHETATSSTVFEALEESKRLSGVNQVLPIVQSRAVESPALLGFIRPWLLLPEGLVEKFTPQELRLVFLHELAHLKRRDIAVNWLTTLLQILHWPNPLVWLAFARMRADRELACDELALSFARAGESQTYGHAMIKLLEGFRRPAVLPGLVGILEDQQQMKRRIAMIAQYRKMTQWSAAAVAVVLILGLVTLTDAQTSAPVDGAAPADTKKPNIGGATTRIIASGTGEDTVGVLSPDESMMAYVNWSNRQFGEVIVKHLGTGELRRVSPDTREPGARYPFPDGDAIWSPDSKLVAYNWYGRSDGQNELRIASVTDGASHVVKPNNPEISYYPEDWSGDGGQLLCTTIKPDRSRALVLVNVATGEARQLMSLEWTLPNNPRFSTDGRYVVFSRVIEGNEDVYALSISGSQLARLVSSPRRESNPVFSRDGRVVLFSSDRRGSWDLWGVRFQEGKAVGPEFLVKPDFGNHNKRITQRGNLAFRSFVSESDGYFAEVSRGGRKPLGVPTPFARSFLGLNAGPTWSPDGKRVAYARQGNLICIQTVETGSEEIFDPGVRRITKLFWSPDGEWMGFVPGGPKNYGMHAYHLATRELRPLHDLHRQREPGVTDIKPVGWSPDGKEFLLHVYPPDKFFYQAVSLADGSLRRLLPSEPAAQFEYFDVSPDGKRVAYATRRGSDGPVELSVADRSLANPRVVAVLDEMRNFGTVRGWNGAAVWPKWSPDGQCIAYYRTVAGRGIELRVVTADGSWDDVVDTGHLKHRANLSPPQWSVDGKKIAMTLVGESRAEIGLLENFEPPQKLASQ